MEYTKVEMSRLLAKRKSDSKYYYANREQKIKDAKARRLRYKKERKCICCACLLLEDEGVKCLNCIERANLGR